MLHAPLERPLHRQREARVKVVPFPALGWNTRDRYQENWRYAPIMTNIRPAAGRGELRSGFTAHATGLPSFDVETLMVYRAGTTEECFAGVGTVIHDVTASGAVGAAVLSATGNAQWQHVMHATSSHQHLVAVNGSKGVVTYEGSTWATQTLTGVVVEKDLIDVTSHKHRLWFVEKTSLNIYYLGTYAIAGAAAKLDLSALFKKGGEITKIDTWSYDGGAGPDDYLVIITDQGEVAVYAGTDPAALATFGVVGVYQIDKPLGRRCTAKLGSDLAILTESGVVLLGQVLGSPDKKDDFSSVIRPEFVAAAISSGSEYGWQLISYARRSELIANVQTNTSAALQFIRSNLNRAWWKSTGMDAICWAECGGDLYFGTASGGHFKADSGTSDDGASIVGDIQPSWSRFGSANLKLFTMMRAHFVTDASFAVLGNIKTDWDESDLEAPVTTFSTSGGAQWDAAQWDVPQWAGALSITGPLATATGEGIVGAPRLRVSTKTAMIQLGAIDVVYTIGGIV